MSEKVVIFGMERKEIERQCRMNPMRTDRDLPIHAGEFLEPCIRGGQKILDDPDLKGMLRRIYRGINA